MDDAKELARKLGLKPASRVVALGASDEFLTKLQQALPDAAPLGTELKTDVRANIILVWPAGAEDLQQMFRRLKQAIVSDGAIWAVIPKRKMHKGTAANLTFGQVQAAALSVDLVDNKIASFSDIEYGIRFVIRREKRGA